MSSEDAIDQEDIGRLFDKLATEAKGSGYFLNPDTEFAKDLVRSLIVNQLRYGYPSCPCRLSSGAKEDDLDIICPCDYRDPDLDEFGACYCALYVSKSVLEGKKRLTSVPERRPSPEEREGQKAHSMKGNLTNLPYPVWRCKVCGYLCAREQPPEACPVCKATKDRFERFM